MARRGWGRRLFAGLLVLVVIATGLLVAADRVGAWYAERTIADQVRQEVAARDISAEEPDVAVGGFPFLTQVLGGRYESISIVLRNVTGEGVRLPRLDVTATGVTADLQTLRTGQGAVVADRVSGTATIGYSTVAELADQPGLTLTGENGKLRARLPVQILGQQVTLVGAAALRLEQGRIRVRVTELDAENGTLPPGARELADDYADQFAVDVPLPELPFDLSLDMVTPRPEGLAVSASARGVPLIS